MRRLGIDIGSVTVSAAVLDTQGVRAVLHRGHGGAILAQGGEDIRIENVTVHSSPGLAVGLVGNRGEILVVRVQRTLQLVQVVAACRRPRHTWRQTVAVGRGQADDFEQERAEHLVEAGYAADADAAQRIAVVRIAQVGESRLLRA